MPLKNSSEVIKSLPGSLIISPFNPLIDFCLLDSNLENKSEGSPVINVFLAKRKPSRIPSIKERACVFASPKVILFVLSAPLKAPHPAAKYFSGIDVN